MKGAGQWDASGSSSLLGLQDAALVQLTYDLFTGDSTISYQFTEGSLFNGTPTHLQEFQGCLGDCYFITAIGTIADSSPAAIQNMFIDNGDGTWTVRFLYDGAADYVTVDRMLPVDSSGRLIYADLGSSCGDVGNTLWIPLAEKAYVEWNETGRAGRFESSNCYCSIEGGWMGDVYEQVLGRAAMTYWLETNSDENALIWALSNLSDRSPGRNCRRLASRLPSRIPPARFRSAPPRPPPMRPESASRCLPSPSTGLTPGPMAAG